MATVRLLLFCSLFVCHSKMVNSQAPDFELLPNCPTNGVTLYTSNNVESLEACQLTCAGIANCLSGRYHAASKSCELRSLFDQVSACREAEVGFKRTECTWDFPTPIQPFAGGCDGQVTWRDVFTRTPAEWRKILELFVTPEKEVSVCRKESDLTNGMHDSITAENLNKCKAICMEYENCQGVEYQAFNICELHYERVVEVEIPQPTTSVSNCYPLELATPDDYKFCGKAAVNDKLCGGAYRFSSTGQCQCLINNQECSQVTLINSFAVVPRECVRFPTTSPTLQPTGTPTIAAPTSSPVLSPTLSPVSSPTLSPVVRDTEQTNLDGSKDSDDTLNNVIIPIAASAAGLAMFGTGAAMVFKAKRRTQFNQDKSGRKSDDKSVNIMEPKSSTTKMKNKFYATVPRSSFELAEEGLYTPPEGAKLIPSSSFPTIVLNDDDKPTMLPLKSTSKPQLDTSTASNKSPRTDNGKRRGKKKNGSDDLGSSSEAKPEPNKKWSISNVL